MTNPLTAPTPPFRVIFDCDPGLDDAVALFMALASPRVTLLGITTVVGNTSLAHIQRNARYLCELTSRSDVKVFAGCPRPLLSWTHYDHARTSIAFDYVQHIHGESGLGSIAFPDPQHPLETQHAVTFLVDTLRSTTDPITLLATGPLTNIATALIMAPDIRSKIERLIIMGGSGSHGNTTPAAEHNFFVDPHAASLVFDAGIPIVLSGLDLTRRLTVTSDFLDSLRSLGAPAVNTLVDIIESRPQAHFEPGLERNVLHDPTVVGFLLAPELFKGRPAHVEIETNAGSCLGRSTIDFFLRKAPNAFVLEEVEVDTFYAYILSLLKRYQAYAQAS